MCSSQLTTRRRFQARFCSLSILQACCVSCRAVSGVLRVRPHACRAVSCRYFSRAMRVVSCVSSVSNLCVSSVSGHACRVNVPQKPCVPCVSCVSVSMRFMRVACHACCLVCVLRVMRVVSTALPMRAVPVRVGNMRVMRAVSCLRHPCHFMETKV